MLGAGLASSTRTGSRSNVRQVQVGNKLQGLPATRNTPVEFALKSINRAAYGEKKTRNVIFCMNQIGGVGAVASGNSSRAFASTSDGVKDCKEGALEKNTSGQIKLVPLNK